MAEKFNINQIDKRVADRYITKGKVKRAEFDAMVQALPDLADKCDNIAELVYPQNEATPEREPAMGEE